MARKCSAHSFHRRQLDPVDARKPRETLRERRAGDDELCQPRPVPGESLADRVEAGQLPEACRLSRVEEESGALRKQAHPAMPTRSACAGSHGPSPGPRKNRGRASQDRVIGPCEQGRRDRQSQASTVFTSAHAELPRLLDWQTTEDEHPAIPCLHPAARRLGIEADRSSVCPRIHSFSKTLPPVSLVVSEAMASRADLGVAAGRDG